MTRSSPGMPADSMARPSWRDSAAGETGTFVDVSEKTTHAFRAPYPARTHTRLTPMAGSR